MLFNRLILDILDRADGRQFWVCGVFRRFAERRTARGETTDDAAATFEAEIAAAETHDLVTVFELGGANQFARQRLAEALSDQFFGPSLAVVASSHEQPVPIFHQPAGGHPSGRDDVREMPAVAVQRRGFTGRAWNRHPSHETVRFSWNRFGPMFATLVHG